MLSAAIAEISISPGHEMKELQGAAVPAACLARSTHRSTLYIAGESHTNLSDNVGGRLEEAHVPGHEERRRDGRVEVPPRNVGKGCDESDLRQPIRDALRDHTRVAYDGARGLIRFRGRSWVGRRKWSRLDRGTLVLIPISTGRGHRVFADYQAVQKRFSMGSINFGIV